MKNENWKEELRKLPRKQCSICERKAYYQNPIDKCFECGKHFCFDHIYGGQVNDKMVENDVIRNICEKCRVKHEYRTL